MRRAQEQTVSGKPYAAKLNNLAGNLAGRIEKGEHPYLEDKAAGAVLLLVVSSDKGLCGSFNSNLLRELMRFVKEQQKVEVISVGKKLKQAVLRTEAVLAADFPLGASIPTFELVLPIATLIKDGFIKGEYKEVMVLFTQFISLGQQQPILQKLLPIGKQVDQEEKEQLLAYTFEPNARDLLTALMPHYLEMSIYQILLESYASEQAARMMAMHQASENAKDVIWQLSLTYNKVRQEKITNELLDIMGGTMGVMV